MYSLYFLFIAAAPYCTDALIQKECQMEIANIAMLEQWTHPWRTLDELMEVASEEADPSLWP